MSYINIKEYTKKKYLISTIVGAGVIILAQFILQYVYSTYFAVSTLNFGIQHVIAAFILAYAIGYFHERIPPCASPFIEKMTRFGLLVWVIILPAFIFFIPTGATLWYIAYLLDLSFAISVLPSVTTVWIMYQFSPKKQLHYDSKKKSDGMVCNLN